MTRSHLLRWFGPASVAAALVSVSAPSYAQAPPLSEAIVVGAWTFRPSVEVRVRGEYRRHPIDAGGNVYDQSAVLAEGYQSTSPTVADKLPGVNNQYLVAERSRFGIAVDRGPVTGVLQLQDARVFGESRAAFVGPGQPTLPSFGPSEAYLDLHARTGRKMFFRLGRQRITWGDGRLIGANDWSATGRSLDAARFGVQIADLDLEAIAVLLAAPGGLPPSVGGAREPAREGLGAQLYGLDAVWHVLPLLQIELAGLARLTREPFPSNLTPSDTYVIDGRVFGEYRGFHYAAEGAYQLGKVASYGTQRTHQALALAARAGLEMKPAHLTIDLEGAYASGDDGSFDGTQKRFDPLLPDEHSYLSPMNAFAWSNILTGGGTVSARPIDELGVMVGYRLANLASKAGRWTTGDLVPVGSRVANDSSSLGHEIDASLKVNVWKPLDIEGGYGLFIFGDGAREILRDVGRPAALQHWAYLQMTVRAPW